MFKRYAKKRCVLPYSLYANHYISRDKVCNHIVECDDIGIRIMIKIALVDIEQILIVTKKVIYIPNLSATTNYDGRDPFSQICLVRELKISILHRKPDCHTAESIILIYK